MSQVVKKKMYSSNKLWWYFVLQTVLSCIILSLVYIGYLGARFKLLGITPCFVWRDVAYIFACGIGISCLEVCLFQLCWFVMKILRTWNRECEELLEDITQERPSVQEVRTENIVQNSARIDAQNYSAPFIQIESVSYNGEELNSLTSTFPLGAKLMICLSMISIVAGIIFALMCTFFLFSGVR